MHSRLSECYKEMSLTAVDEADQQAIKAIPPGGLLDSAATIEKDFGEAIKVVQKLMSDNSEMVQKYNSLLAIAQSQQAQLQAANSRQQRINNAVAVYNIMPKYTCRKQSTCKLPIAAPARSIRGQGLGMNRMEHVSIDTRDWAVIVRRAPPTA